MTNPFSTITTAGNGAGRALRIWRGETTQDGEPVFEDSQYDFYAMVPKGEYRLRITGLQEPYQEEIAMQYRKRLQDGTVDPDGPTHKTNTGLEVEIVGGPHAEKRVFFGFITASLSDGGNSGNKANMRYVFDAACPEGGTEMGDMLGQEFSGYLKPSDNGKRMILVYNTCSPVEEAAADADSAPKANPFKKSA